MRKNEQGKYKKVIAGLYCRLSDDDEQDGTSVSIETQKKVNGEYCKNNGFLIYDFYCDDGFSGTNFERPDFKRMMNDAKDGKINTIIVKDLSRFGRNYLKVGAYISEIFPEMGIRFIAIGDDVDSEKKELDYDLMLPIKNIFNEYYPADCSRKIKQAFAIKVRNGEFIGSQAPLGYMKSASDHHVLEIDEAAAPIIRRIFEMAAYKGYGYNKIARVLSAEKVMTPAAYQAKVAGRKYEKDPYDWNLTTVYTIFRNITYLGHLVSGRKKKISFKSKKVVKQPEDKWIVVENMFPPLISQQLWDDAHNALSRRKRESESGFENVFAGLIKCDKCGYALGIANATERSNYFVCNTYKKKGPTRCSSHYIKYDELYDAVKADINDILQMIRLNKQCFIDEVMKKISKEIKSGQSASERELESLEQRIAELDIKYDSLYDDKLSGLISDRKFKELSERCEAEQDEARAQYDILKKQALSYNSEENNVENFVKIAETYDTVDELDREMLNRMIDSIIIGDRLKYKGENMQTVTINYRFVGNIA